METTLADIWKELLIAHKTIQNVDVYSRFESFKRHCLETLESQTKVYHEEIYVAAFFLHPKYRCVAVSKKHSLSDVTQMIIRLAKQFKLTKGEALTLQDAVNRYYNRLYPYNSKNVDKPLDYWLTVPETPESDALKKPSIGLLEIVPHAAGVKGLFSMMNAIKTKARNRMSTTTLKMMTQLKLHLLQGDSLLNTRKKRKQKDGRNSTSEYENINTYDAFLTPAELEAFENGVYTEEQTALITVRENAFMDTLFDFDKLENPAPEKDIIDLDQIQDNPAETDWSPDEIMAP
ncbi:hypothetical protein PCASD_04505 [Puccinia coronata f. sp. avenae]|uniref:HAT C-terminal dimerisation domain-containing protein n=1 Tax=Puccinia coronata f. sp. avenae TaxID=200324 RepID=A0A2N5V3B3_9BASI|nr:hypothetical protein PCASD_04505 [Puccinia coronata f. sp. avenae]